MKITSNIEEIAEIVRKGGVIAYPTEAVFGLGCDPSNANAIQKILKLKSRAIEKGLILIASDWSQLSAYLLPLNDNIQTKIAAPRQHPTTWLLPARKETSLLLKGDHDSQAVRIILHDACSEFCDTLGHALVSTSANPAGQQPAHTVDEVIAYFDCQLDGILDRATGGFLSPSKIIDPYCDHLIRGH